MNVDVFVLILDHGYDEIDLCGVYSSVDAAKAALGDRWSLEYVGDGYWKSSYDPDILGNFELCTYTLDENTKVMYPPSFQK